MGWQGAGGDDSCDVKMIWLQCTGWWVWPRWADAQCRDSPRFQRTKDKRKQNKFWQEKWPGRMRASQFWWQLVIRLKLKSKPCKAFETCHGFDETHCNDISWKGAWTPSEGNDWAKTRAGSPQGQDRSRWWGQWWLGLLLISMMALSQWRRKVIFKMVKCFLLSLLLYICLLYNHIVHMELSNHHYYWLQT